MCDIREPLTLRIKRIGNRSSITTGELHPIRPTRIRDEHFIACSYRCAQGGSNRPSATHSNGSMLWPNRIAVDALNFSSQQLSQPRPASRRTIGHRLSRDGFNSRLSNVLRRKKTRLTDLQPCQRRQALPTNLCLLLQLLGKHTKMDDVIWGHVV